MDADADADAEAVWKRMDVGPEAGLREARAIATARRATNAWVGGGGSGRRQWIATGR